MDDVCAQFIPTPAGWRELCSSRTLWRRKNTCQMYQGDRFIKYVKPSRAFFQSDPPSKLFSGQELSSFCKHIKRNAQMFKKTVRLRNCCLSLGRGGGLYKRTHLCSSDWHSSTHWLPYYCREITSNMHTASLAGKTPSRDQECQVGRWQIWHGRKLCLGSYCANLHYFIPDQLKLWKIKDVLFLGHISLFAEWYSLFFSWFFSLFLLFFFFLNKACSSGLELSMGSHQHSCFLFQSCNLGDFYIRKLTSWRLELSASFEPSCFHCTNEDKCCGGNIFPTRASKNLLRQLWTETMFWKRKTTFKGSRMLEI